MALTEIEGKPGHFEMNQEALSFRPEDVVVVTKYTFRDAFMDVAKDELVARLIVTCQEAGGWCGVAMSKFMADIRAEREAGEKIYGATPLDNLALHLAATQLAVDDMLIYLSHGSSDRVIFPTEKMSAPLMNHIKPRD